MGEVAFQVQQAALATIQNLSIDANFSECEAALKEMIEPYKTMVVTEDGIASAKADRARIRKVSASIDEARKTVKKAYNAPLAKFEDRCKALVAICDEGSINLDNQVKAYEEAEAQEKIDSIRAVYDEGDSEVREFCSWERVYNDKWKNKGFGFDDAKDAILAEFSKTREDLATIRTMDERDIPALLTEYKRTHDIGAAIRLSNTLKNQREEEAKRKAEEENQKRTEQIEESLRKNEEAARESAVEYAPSKEPESVKPTDFRVWATQRQLMSLKGFLRANGIKYGRVPD